VLSFANYNNITTAEPNACINIECLKKRHWCGSLWLQRLSTDFRNFGRDVAEQVCYRIL